MATLEQAREILAAWESRELNVSEAEDGYFSVETGEGTFRVSGADIEEQIARGNTIHYSGDPSIWYPGYYEHILQPTRVLRPLFYRRDLDFRLEESGAVLSVEPVSRFFALFLFCLGKESPLGSRRNRLSILRRAGWSRQEENDISAPFSHLFGVRVCLPQSRAAAGARSSMRAIAEAGLFHYSFERGGALLLADSWDAGRLGSRRRDKRTTQFPKRTYIPALVAYYQRGISCADLDLAYLSLYKVLEHFFPQVSRQRLHERLREQLAAPDFSACKPEKLEALADATRKHDQKVNEIVKLKAVLDLHLDRVDLRAWVESYAPRKKAHYLEDREVFGKQMERLDTSDDQILHRVAKRIYALRNALAHGKDDDGEARFIPFHSEHEQQLALEIPLLQHIAEQIIIKTGTDLDLTA